MRGTLGRLTTLSALLGHALLGGAPVAAQEAGARPPVRSVAAVDLARYAGTWHEIAKFPNRFQKDCARATTASYALQQDGSIKVVNVCVTPEGKEKRAEGKARLADAKGPTSQLKVRFAPGILSWIPAVWGDYWILDLTDDYRAVLVGSPDREYLWILARTPELDAPTWERLVASGAAQGFDMTRLARSAP